MAKLNSINQLLLLALMFSIIKVTHGQGKLVVTVDEYDEKSNDRTTKCIKSCVTTSPSGFPRCNINGTTDTATAEFFTVGATSFPSSRSHHFYFIKWEDNSELSLTVWKLPSGQSCDTSAPNNDTYYGEADIIIPRLEQLKSHRLVSDKWKLKIRTKLTCDKSGCLQSCVPRNNSIGHYTCVDGNKKCLENWFNVHANCTTFCNKNSLNYNCTKNGNRVCNPEYFGEDCDIFCDRNATNYKCDEKGKRTCLPNWYNQNCEQFCDSSKGNYVCDNEGQRVCLLHWYGENCTKYCNNSAERYKCNDKGDIVCSRDWYGSKCSKFCDNNNKRFKCNSNGEKVCLKNWYGKDCIVFCNNSDTHYKCNVKGDRICLRDWYGPKCLKFCSNHDKRYTCNSDGDKVCLRNWYGRDCMKYCNTSAKHFKCDDKGDRICMQNWYGKNCTRFCNNTAALSDGKTVKYFCNKNGQKTCSGNRYGPQCNLVCTAVMTEPFETNSGHEQSDIGLYYCEIEERIQQEDIRCPKGWKDTLCLQGCHDINEYVQTSKTKCKERTGKALLCSKNTTTKGECVLKDPLQLAGTPKASHNDMSEVKLYGGLFGTLLLMLIITTIVIVYMSVKKRAKATTSPVYETPRAMTNDVFNRNFNRAEMTFTIDDFIRRRQSSANELGYDNEGMMVENPLYNSSMRAVAPFQVDTSSTASPDEVFAMSNTAV